MKQVTIDIDSFTQQEQQAIQSAAASLNMTLSDYIIFLLQGVATPPAN